jgi:hypothetical protein
MTVTTEHGNAEAIKRMVRANPDRSPLDKDLAVEIHNLALRHMEATGEKNYSTAVRTILAMDQAIAQAYASYGRYGDSMAIKLPLRGSNGADGRHHDVGEVVLVLARQHMVKTGEKDLGRAARAVLRDNPALAEQYIAMTSR